MDVVGDDERHDILAAVGRFAVLVFDEFREFARVADVSKHLETVCLSNQGSRSRQEVGARDVVVDTTDDRTAVARGQDVFLDTHQNLGFGTSLFGLNHVEVHLVSVKVSVVRGTHCQIEPEGVAFHDADFVNHHRHAVKRRLSVEDGDVAVDQVAFHLQAGLGVAVSVEGRKTVLNTGSLFAPLVKGTATVWAGHFEVFWERFGVGIVCLSQLVHPAVVEDGSRVVLSQLLTVFINALKVVQGGCIVHNVADFFRLVHATE